MIKQDEFPAELEAFTKVLVQTSKVDAYIEKYLGREWSCQQQDFWAENTCNYMEAFKDPEATEIVEAWLASPIAEAPGRLGQSGYGESVNIYTSTILSELCNRGLFPEGELELYSW